MQLVQRAPAVPRRDVAVSGVPTTADADAERGGSGSLYRYASSDAHEGQAATIQSDRWTRAGDGAVGRAWGQQ
eukprot:6051112-Lingulodinium_polyedra.AAC.1